MISNSLLALGSGNFYLRVEVYRVDYTFPKVNFEHFLQGYFFFHIILFLKFTQN